MLHKHSQTIIVQPFSHIKHMHGIPTHTWNHEFWTKLQNPLKCESVWHKQEYCKERCIRMSCHHVAWIKSFHASLYPLFEDTQPLPLCISSSSSASSSSVDAHRGQGWPSLIQDALFNPSLWNNISGCISGTGQSLEKWLPSDSTGAYTTFIFINLPLTGQRLGIQSSESSWHLCQYLMTILHHKRALWLWIANTTCELCL